ncbi:DUF1775 domain-containing protein [Micromonospora sp. WMMC250]|uniref:DUF1775 domain-containing protein n=1 Tax=Micromonospora sp. WMMC250 TaxID=3014781 RepID=UPI0022B68C78|nr:DUF1775 domain-containing protein [Micromonospora sp. WMMC250]MCZ7379807.1 DUF1775 domain-containing protein [Micromonospora sp. WMMC250]
MRRRYYALAVTMLAGAASTVAIGTPASAHTGVKVSPARALASNAVVTVNAEAENDNAGVKSVQVFLPDGITAPDVTLLKAPKGWKLSSTAADSYTVGGPAVPVGTDAEHQVRVRQLPNAPQVSFKILQTYSDGRVDRWIEVPSAANPEPANPAPTVKLAAAAPPASAAPTTAPATPSAAPSSAATDAPATDAAVTAFPSANDEPAAGNGGLWIGVGVLLAVIAAVGAALYLRQRRRQL